MAPRSSILAWKIPWTEEPGRLQSMGSWRVRHDWATSLSLFTFMHWRRKWQPTPVFLPGESQGCGGLVGCHPWGHTESDTTEATQQQSSMCCTIGLCWLCILNIAVYTWPSQCFPFLRGKWLWNIISLFWIHSILNHITKHKFCFSDVWKGLWLGIGIGHRSRHIV